MCEEEDFLKLFLEGIVATPFDSVVTIYAHQGLLNQSIKIAHLA